jgi:hypothetical protein
LVFSKTRFRCKQVLVGGPPSGGGRDGEGKGGGIRLMYFIYLHENKIGRPVAVVLSKGEGG